MSRQIDLDYVAANRDQLDALYPGQYALIAGGELQSVWPSLQQAVRVACHLYNPAATVDPQRFGPGSFEVYHCAQEGGG